MPGQSNIIIAGSGTVHTLHQFQSMTFDLSFTLTFIFNCKILTSFLSAVAAVLGNCIFWAAMATRFHLRIQISDIMQAYKPAMRNPV